MLQRYQEERVPLAITRKPNDFCVMFKIDFPKAKVVYHYLLFLKIYTSARGKETKKKQKSFKV